MIALDTNILVHAHRRGTAHHEEALALLAALSEGAAPYALFWPSLYEFLRVVTHHRLFDPPLAFRSLRVGTLFSDQLRPEFGRDRRGELDLDAPGEDLVVATHAQDLAEAVELPPVGLQVQIPKLGSCLRCQAQ